MCELTEDIAIHVVQSKLFFVVIYSGRVVQLLCLESSCFQLPYSGFASLNSRSRQNYKCPIFYHEINIALFGDV